MREIKFRAWDKETDKRINIDLYGSNFYFNPTTGQMYSKKGHLNQTCHLVLEQYTGLKDKNGKEIYEGDILAIPKNKTEDYYFPPLVVIFHAGAFLQQDSDTGSVDEWREWDKLEIIGNIHENPELLEEINEN